MKREKRRLQLMPFAEREEGEDRKREAGRGPKGEKAEGESHS